MGYTTFNDIKKYAYSKARELIESHKKLKDATLIAAILYGEGINPNSNDVSIRLLEVLEGTPNNPFNQLRFEVVEFGSTRDFLIPGALKITLATKKEFDYAMRTLHPEILALFPHYKILYDSTGTINNKLHEAKTRWEALRGMIQKMDRKRKGL